MDINYRGKGAGGIGEAAMSKISQRIIKSASKLFSEKGYEHVSLRHIADEAGTTIGNLTYHYPQKDKLLEAILLEVQNRFYDKSTMLAELEDQPLRGIVRLVGMMQEGRRKHPLYFRNMLDLCKHSEPICENMGKYSTFLYDYLRQSFARLVADGLMRDDITPRGYAFLARMAVITTSLWQQSMPPHVKLAPMEMDMEQAVHGLLYPYLTPAGIKEYERLAAARKNA